MKDKNIELSISTIIGWLSFVISFVIANSAFEILIAIGCILMFNAVLILIKENKYE